MADLCDVENALLLALQMALAPSGVPAGSASAGSPRLYRGLPVDSALAADIASGVTNIVVSPVGESARNTTRWNVQATRPAPWPGTTVLARGDSVTLGGAPAAGDLVGLLLGDTPLLYAVTTDDTPLTIAAGLANQASGIYPCLQNATTLTFPTAPRLIARVTAPVGVRSEWSRQEQAFKIAVLSPDPTTRDTIGRAITAALAGTAFLTLADQSAARIRYRSTAVLDDERESSVYRRDIVYDIEYPTISVTMEPTVLFGELGWNSVSYFG